MTNTLSYDFSPYREQVFQIVRKQFFDATKQGLPVDINRLCSNALKQIGLPLNCSLKKEVLNWLNDIYYLNFLKVYLKDTELQELILHSPATIQIQGLTREYKNINQLDQNDFQIALEILAQKNHQTWNYSKPYCSFQTELFDLLYRVTLCHFSLTPEKNSKAFFRALRPITFSLKNFFTKKEQTKLFLESLHQKKNILIVGPTGSGKTSLLRSLIEAIPSSEHIIILEDTYELITHQDHITNLIAGEGEMKSLHQYCSYALRMKPDRLIIGEIRSSEVIPFLLASNIGHKGLMTSLHANTAVDALTRLSLLFQIYSPQKGLTFQEVLKLICQGIDLIAYCQSGKVTEVIQVLGSEGTTPYYTQVI